jgi:hypothetical protein
MDNREPGYNDEEIARRRDDVIRRMANTPPKPHSEMKVGKRKAKMGTNASQPKRLEWSAKVKDK